jgi:glutamate dehydrogenase
VYSPRVEGVHMRMGYVARGGLRWSDRREDFRTESARPHRRQQNVKNTVIVPVGAKVGFYPNGCPPAGSREEVQKEVIASYQTFIRGLLDVTDNIVNGKTWCGRASCVAMAMTPTWSSPPTRARHVLRHRQCHLHRVRPLARRRIRLGRLGRLRPQGHGHHSARRLGVREAALPRDRRRHPVAGVHLRRASATCRATCSATACCSRSTPAWWRRSITGTSSSIRIPTAAASFRERERLFKLPRSSWDDYSRKLISRGGGVWPRTAKSIPLVAEARTLLGCRRPPHPWR